MSDRLHTPEEIRAAGAEAVRGWRLNERQVDQIVALLHPVRDEVWRPLDEPKNAADAA
ncbi:hypothetical protein [Micromonospora sp. L32]|uniref:hypothetical protein n=1 Tax=Micromonospora sp. L32 TaxID=3452214 RepID=UPI003F8C4182